jgi:hypothetical protein
MEKKALTRATNVMSELFKFLKHTSTDEAWKNDKREIEAKVSREMYTQHTSTWKDPKFNLN